MLILTRRPDEVIYIGDDIHVAIIDIRGNQVRVGVHAPKNIAVHREEVYQRIMQQRGAAFVKGNTEHGD